MGKLDGKEEEGQGGKIMGREGQRFSGSKRGSCGCFINDKTWTKAKRLD